MKKEVLYIISAILTALFAAALIIFSFQQRGEVIYKSPPVDYWEMFAGISLERKFIEEADAYYRIPVFTSELLAHKGKEVTLSGYYLPYSQIDSVIIISRFPYANCFFCGGAGVESVAMVELKGINGRSYRTDQILTAKGKLTLNSTNFKKLAFVIEDASVEEALD